MANINLLTPQSIYSRSIAFSLNASQTPGNYTPGNTAEVKYATTPVAADKTQHITSLSFSNEEPSNYEWQFVRIYKRLPNQTDELLMTQLGLSNVFNYLAFTKEASFSLQENEALVIGLTGRTVTGTPYVWKIRGYISYLEIQ